MAVELTGQHLDELCLACINVPGFHPCIMDGDAQAHDPSCTCLHACSQSVGCLQVEGLQARLTAVQEDLVNAQERHQQSQAQLQALQQELEDAQVSTQVRL